MKHGLGFLDLVESLRPKVDELSVDEVKKMQDDDEAFLLIDVREDREWANGSIAGAVHMGRGVIERDIAAAVPNPETKIVLYCGGGYRSVLSAYNLQQMGYSEVSSMDGGWSEWKQKGYPTA